MRAALIGYGKMGKRVEAELLSKGHDVISIIDPQEGLFPLKQEYLSSCDICIDFSHATFVLENVSVVASLNKPLLIGTTGWESELDSVKNIVQESKIGCLYAPNFSLGVALFNNLVSRAASLFDPFPEYDRCGIEMHHRYKTDSPSGTAKLLEKSAKLKKPFLSIRCGEVPGTHTLHFEGESDTITLMHSARSRDGFAKGAVYAASWLIGKQGFFTLDDALWDSLKA